MNFKKLILQLVICYLALLPPQLFGQINCTNSSSPELSVLFGELPYSLPSDQTTIPLNDIGDIVGSIEDIAICGPSKIINLFIIPNNSSSTYSFPCQFELDLDEIGENDIQLASISSANVADGWSIVSGQGTAHAVLQFDGQISNEIYILSIRISASCELLRLITDGNTAEIENNQINFNGCYNNGGADDICFGGTSESFNINYNLITLQEGNTVTTVDLGEYFNMTKAMEVSGDFCVRNFETYVTVPENTNLDDLEVKVQMSVSTPGLPTPLLVEPVPDSDVSIEGNLICIQIRDNYGGLNYDYCNQNFPGGMGEIQLSLCSLRIEECPAGPFTWRTNSCQFFRAGFGCQEPNITCYPQSESICYVNVPNGDPQLSVSALTFDWNLDFCNDRDSMVYRISNTSNDVAYDIQFNIDNWQGIVITGAFLYGQKENGDPVNNPISALPSEVVEFNAFPNAGTLDFDFTALRDSNFGLFDYNGDGIYSELGPGQSIAIEIKTRSGCPFGNDLTSNCSPDQFFPSVIVWRGLASWNNQCRTNSESDLEQGTTQMFGEPSGVVLQCPGTQDVVPGEAFSFNYCVGEWELRPDFNESFFDLDPMTNIFQVNTGGASGLTPVGLILNGTTYLPTSLGGGVYEFDLGEAGLPPGPFDGRVCMELLFDFNCPSIPFDGPINVETTLFGQWECPMSNNCRMTIGCGATELYPQCPCEPSDAECESCDLLVTESFSVQRPMAPPGGNSCGAYVCDPIEMSISGTVRAGYSGPIGGYFTMGLFDNGLDLISELAVTATLDGAPLDVGLITVEGAPLRCYRFQTESVNVSSDATVVFSISGIADQEAIEGMPVFAYTVNQFIGGLAQVGIDGFQKCTESDVSAVFQFYKVEPIHGPQDGGFANCNSGIRFNLGFGYRGGTVGDDFPSEYRPINELIDTLHVQISGADGLELVSFQNGNQIWDDVSGTSAKVPVSSIFGGFNAPDKTQFEEITQEIRVNAVGNCGIADGTAIYLNYTAKLKHNLFSPTCQEEIMVEGEAVGTFFNGRISTTPSNPNIVTYTGNSINGGSAPLEICFNATGRASDVTWAQFSYPTGTLNIQRNGLEGTTCTEDGSGMTTEWFPIPGGIDEAGACMEFDYEVLSCDITEIPLSYAIGKACYDPDFDFNADGRILGIEIASLVDNTACDSECLSEGAFNIEIEPSQLVATIEQCSESADICGDEVTFSIIAENPGGGITSNIALDVALPDNVELVEASYRYPYNVNTSPCGSNAMTPISGADNGPVVFLNELEGTQTASGDAQRRVLVQVKVRFTSCPSETTDNNLTFTISGQRNCGEPVVLEFDQFEEIIGSDFVDFDVQLSTTVDSVNQDCKDGRNIGVLYLGFSGWDPEEAELPDNQTINLFLTSFGIIEFEVASDEPIAIDYGQTSIAIPFSISDYWSCGDVNFRARLETTDGISCGEQLCNFKSFTQFYQIPINPDEIGLESVTIGEEACTESQATVTLSFAVSSDFYDGYETPVEIYCDNGSGPQGSPIYTGTHTVSIPPSTTGQFEGTITITLPSSDILNTCDGRIRVFIPFSGNCFCFVDREETAELCCDYCPEVGLIAECQGENNWLLTIQSDDPLNDLLVNYTFVGGIPDDTSATGSTILIPFTQAPSKIIALIFTNDYSTCDEEEISIGNSNEGKPGEAGLEILSFDCEERICLPLDSCHAQGDFSYIQGYSGDLWTLDVDAVISTNMSNHQIAWMVNGSIQNVFGSEVRLEFSKPGDYEICMLVTGEYRPNCQKPEACKISICDSIRITKDDKACWTYPDFNFDIDDHGKVTFNNRTTYNGKDIEYFWYFGDGEESKEESPEHFYKKEGEYEVTLVVKVYGELEDCEEKIIKKIKVVFGKGGPVIGGGGKEGLGSSAFQSLLFPNPVREVLTFEWQGVEPQSGVVEVFSISGQRIFREEAVADSAGQSRLQISVAQWPSGMYLLKFTGERDSATHRFVVD